MLGRQNRARALGASAVNEVAVHLQADDLSLMAQSDYCSNQKSAGAVQTFGHITVMFVCDFFPRVHS